MKSNINQLEKHIQSCDKNIDNQPKINPPLERPDLPNNPQNVYQPVEFNNPQDVVYANTVPNQPIGMDEEAEFKKNMEKAMLESKSNPVFQENSLEEFSVSEEESDCEDDLFKDKLDNFKTQNQTRKVDWIDGSEKLQIDRNSILEESMDKIYTLDPMKELKIDFTNDSGMDAGGLIREWFTCCFAELLKPEKNLFILAKTSEIAYIINPFSESSLSNLRYFRFVGFIIGKAMLENININTCLSPLVFKQIFRGKLRSKHVRLLDENLFNSVSKVKTKDLEALELYYTATLGKEGEGQEVELVPKGGDTKIITVGDYFAAYVNFFNEKNEMFVEAIQEGLFEVIPRDKFEHFTPREIKMIVEGKGSIDVVDWKKHTVYKGDYSETHETIVWFWEILGELTQKEKEKFLRFCIGTTRLPIEGFKYKSNQST